MIIIHYYNFFNNHFWSYIPNYFKETSLGKTLYEESKTRKKNERRKSFI